MNKIILGLAISSCFCNEEMPAEQSKQSTSIVSKVKQFLYDHKKKIGIAVVIYITLDVGYCLYMKNSNKVSGSKNDQKKITMQIYNTTDGKYVRIVNLQLSVAETFNLSYLQNFNSQKRALQFHHHHTDKAQTFLLLSAKSDKNIYTLTLCLLTESSKDAYLIQIAQGHFPITDKPEDRNMKNMLARIYKLPTYETPQKSCTPNKNTYVLKLYGMPLKK